MMLFRRFQQGIHTQLSFRSVSIVIPVNFFEQFCAACCNSERLKQQGAAHCTSTYKNGLAEHRQAIDSTQCKVREIPTGLQKTSQKSTPIYKEVQRCKLMQKAPLTWRFTPTQFKSYSLLLLEMAYGMLRCHEVPRIYCMHSTRNVKTAS